MVRRWCAQRIGSSPYRTRTDVGGGTARRSPKPAKKPMTPMSRGDCLKRRAWNRATDRMAEAALANIRWALSHQQSNGWFDRCCLTEPSQPLTHTVDMSCAVCWKPIVFPVIRHSWPHADVRRMRCYRSYTRLDFFQVACGAIGLPPPRGPVSQEPPRSRPAG